MPLLTALARHGGTSEMSDTQSERGVSKLKHSEDVYSYFMFAIPLEDRKNPGKCTWNRVLAYTLVLFTMILQSILLYTIFEKVVNGDALWRRSILNPRGEGFFGDSILHPMTDHKECNDGKSLCLRENGTYTCAPPSVQLTGRWQELDRDGDGIWTRAEAEASREDLQCRFAVNVVEVFDVFVKFLVARENIIWIHPELRSGEKIHKTYFTYASGDVIMCGYRNTDMCANLLDRGVFDAPLRYGTAPRVGKTIDSALEYCQKLLEPGGVCERSLPSTYAVWKKASNAQCRDPDYDKFVYEHPLSKRTKSMLTVDYDAVQAYTRAGSLNLFVVFKTIIIGIYLLAMLGECKTIYSIVTWLRTFPVLRPSAASTDEDTDAEKAEEPEQIKGITSSHRTTMVIFTIIRFFMLFVLTWVGLMFLLKDTDYIDLLLNALGLIVVVELTENVYMYLLSPELRDEVEEVGSMTVPVRGEGFFTKQPAVKDLLVLALFVLATISVMTVNHVAVVEPLTKSLQCACLSDGPQCFEAQQFSKQFWDNYWTKDVPQVFEDLDKLKGTVSFGDFSLAALGARNGTAAKKLLPHNDSVVHEHSTRPATRHARKQGKLSAL